MNSLHKITAALTSVLAASFAAGAATAQDDPEIAEFYAGPPEIVLYDFPNFNGQSLTLNADADNITRQGFNDRTSSIRVLSGNWEVCYDANYRSRCVEITEDMRQLGAMDNQISSVRILRSNVGGGIGGGGRNNDITFFAGPNFTGQSVTLDSAVSNFQRLRFNDRARSVRYSGRGSWRVCQHDNYGGQCSEITGDVRDLAVIRLANQISSAAPSGRGNGGGRPGGGNGAFEPREGVRLFDGRGFSGQRYDVLQDTYDLNRTGFNDRTESIAIAPGEVWEFCMDSNYRSQCRTFSESIDDLGSYRFDNTISSMRRVYGGGGRPGGNFPGGPGRPGGGYRGPIDGEVEGIGAAFFPVPEVNGYAIDRCLGSNGQDCDAAAADYICREAGYVQAAYFTVDRGRRYRTLHIGENSQCRTGRCEAILNLTCVNE